jgi:hypothetical protein
VSPRIKEEDEDDLFLGDDVVGEAAQEAPAQAELRPALAWLPLRSPSYSNLCFGFAESLASLWAMFNKL